MELIPFIGIDYSQLENFLVAGNFRAADMETRNLMIKLGNREKEGWLDTEHIQRFPCQDLLTIDRLWRQYSNDRFGFSVQKPLWENAGGQLGKLDTPTVYIKFCDRIGWRVNGDWVNYENLIFTFNAPVGHLPFQGFMSLYGGMMILFSRLSACGL